MLEVHPLLPADAWEWFALEGVRYHGHSVDIVWDREGKRFGRGAGLVVLVDGKESARAPRLERVTAKLPPAQKP